MVGSDLNEYNGELLINRRVLKGSEFLGDYQYFKITLHHESNTLHRTLDIILMKEQS
jgi:hypothetical protein